jgi:hypothetical protein
MNCEFPAMVERIPCARQTSSLLGGEKFPALQGFDTKNRGEPKGCRDLFKKFSLLTGKSPC